MENHDLVFLFIHEENQIRTSRRVFKLTTALEQLKMEGRSPHDSDTPFTLLRAGTYRPNFIIINVDHPEIDEILNEAKEWYPYISIIALYDPANMEKLQEIEDKYHIKYEWDRSAITTFSLNSLFLKIKSEKAFNQKNENMRYTLIQSLGDGASSIVDLYFDNEWERKVAVKKIQVEGMKQIEKEQVKKEVDNMKSIRVPTSIEFYDFEIENDNRFIYMEYADQGTLAKRIYQYRRNGQMFPADEIFEYLLEIMLALYALNKKGMMHRDIKSENILLKEERINGERYIIAKLSDLGISRQIDGVLGSLTSCGTPYYVSPEIAAGAKRYDYTADIWSLGVVLYEWMTLNKPWFNIKLSAQELFALVFSTKYPPLPKETDEKWKYLLSIMLKKDPNRRSNWFEILKIDFVYEKVIKLIKKYGWENIQDFQGWTDFEKDLHPCYLLMSVLKDEDFNYWIDASKWCMYSLPCEYKAKFFGPTVKNARNGSEIIATHKNLVSWENEMIHSKDTPEELIKYLIEKKIMIPLSHSVNIENSEEISAFTTDLIESPENYYFKFTFCSFEASSAMPDNEPLCNCSILNDENIGKFDFLALSQFILKQGKMLYTDNWKNQIEPIQLVTDPRYLKFLQGISYFQDCDLFKLPYCDEDKTRLAFWLNVYQIMLIHAAFNAIQKNVKIKSSLLGYFQYDISISYKFKNFLLNDLELKHVVFRNNKPAPGSYLRLVYNSDPKCQLLPNFDNKQALLMMYDFVTTEFPDITLKIFKSKEIDEDLNDITFKFMQNNISLSVDEFYISSYIKGFLTDFGQNNTPDFPEGFLQFILKYYNMHKEFNTKDPQQPYKVRLSSNDMKTLEFLTQKFLKDIHSGNIKVWYI